jgi:prepilin-type N-terminal cleavage/methylation domain-containing protein
MKRAFSLIELLVVIAIVAIVAAVLFPVFAKAREQARKARCISNLEQLGVATGAYLSDWDERYPWAWLGDNMKKYQVHPVFRETMTAYVPDPRLWQCPSDTGEVFLHDFGRRLDYPSPPFHSDGMYRSSYGYLGMNWGGFYGELTGRRTSDVKRPTLAVLLVEARPWHGGYRRNENSSASPARQNVLCCDGHVARRSHAEWTSDAYLGVKE